MKMALIIALLGIFLDMDISRVAHINKV